MLLILAFSLGAYVGYDKGNEIGWNNAMFFVAMNRETVYNGIFTINEDGRFDWIPENEFGDWINKTGNYNETPKR